MAMPIDPCGAADEAKLEIQRLIKKGDLILVKASHAIGMDKIIEEIKAK